MKEQQPKTEAPHARTMNEVADSLGSDAVEGLSRREAQQRLEQSGYNELIRHKARSPWRILLEQFHGVLLWVLLAALAVALALQEWPEAVAIAAVILVNTLIGFLAEWKATRTIDALRQKEEVHATVIRDGGAEDVPVRELVPGDLIELKPEKIVPADARVVESAGLRIDEAALTGESGPVSKGPDPVDGNTPLAERSCMVFKGCAVVDGGGRALVTGTGMQTELGNIADAAMHAESGETPLRVRLDQLGRRFVWLVLISCVFVGVAGWWRGRGTAEIIETAVALGIAAVPEGLPIVASIALAHGMWKMGKHNAIVKKLQAVQALGSVPVLFVDKTGTLTQNRMQLVRVSTPSGDWDPAGSEAPDVAAAEVLEVGVLCNGAEIKEDKEEGDPMEIALLKAGYKYGRGKDRPEEELSHLRTVQFDRETMMMAAYHQRKADDTLHVSVKGAPERVLQACSRIRNGNRGKDLDGPGRKEWTHKAEKLAGDAGDRGSRCRPDRNQGAGPGTGSSERQGSGGTGSGK